MLIDFNSCEQGVGVLCGRLEVKQGQALFDPAITWGPRTVGQTGGVVSYDLACASGQVPVGLTGLFTTTVAPREMPRIGLICDTPVLEF